MRLLLLAAILAAPALTAPPRWVASWGSGQQPPEERNLAPAGSLKDATLRQVVRLSVGGSAMRVRFSNAFGTKPLVIDGAHLALSADKGSARIVGTSDRALLFGGRAQVSIPAGADYLSDPVAMAAPALASLTISVHFPDEPAGQTGHPGSRATSWIAPGDRGVAADLPDARAIEHWYQLAGVEVTGPAARGTVVALGDSITDGNGATTNGDDRWPDMLAARLRTRGIGVVNVGIGGNRVLLDGLGPSALARFDRDVLARPGVRAVIVFEGVNDIGTLDAKASEADHRRLVADVVAGYRQMIDRAHAQGIRVVGCTVTAFGTSFYDRKDGRGEADRQAINAWIRTAKAFDAVADFDLATRDPADPSKLRAAFDKGDHLHLTPAAFAEMAAAVPAGTL